MTQNRFAYLVRSYGRLAARTHLSYGVQVQAAYDLRVGYIDAKVADPVKADAAKIAARALIRNEYAPQDRSWTLRSDPA